MMAVETGTVICQKLSPVVSECLGSAEEVKRKEKNHGEQTSWCKVMLLHLCNIYGEEQSKSETIGPCPMVAT